MLFTLTTTMHEVFLFPDLNGRLGIGKWLRAVDCVNNQAVHLI